MTMLQLSCVGNSTIVIVTDMGMMGGCFLCLYTQPFAVMVATGRMVAVCA